MQQIKPPDEPYAPYTPTNNEWYWMDRHSKNHSEGIYRNSEAIRRLNITCCLLTIALGIVTAPVLYLFYDAYFSPHRPVTITIEKAPEKPLPTPSPLLPALPQSN